LLERNNKMFSCICVVINLFSFFSLNSLRTLLSMVGVPQTFTDFTARSRYWRLLLVDNHGGKCICFHGIRFYGADDRIRQLLKENDMDHYADDIVSLVNIDNIS
jgi:hypothetical protein